MKKTLLALFFFIISGLACPAANAETDLPRKYAEFRGLVGGFSENSLAIAVLEDIAFIEGISNLEIYKLPLMAAAERGQTIYIQFRSIGNGNCEISFFRLVPLPRK